MNTFLRKKFLYINSTDAEVIRKGRLLQFLILLFLFVGFGRFFFLVINNLINGPTIQPPIPYYLPLLFIIVPAISWWLVRNGRIRRASHLFALSSNIMFFLLFLNSPDSDIPYLILIGVVAISVLDTVLVGTIYALASLMAVTAAFFASDQYGSLDIINYWLTAVGICVTVWVISQDLTSLVNTSRGLVNDIQSKNIRLQHSAQQVQISSEITQLSGQSLDPETLLRDTVRLIRDRFGFYHVIIFLADEKNQQLVVHEATGDAGAVMMANGISVPINDKSLPGWVASRKQALAAEEISHAAPYRLPDTRAELGLPLVSRGQLLGVLNVQSRTAVSFEPGDINILQIMANQLAVNIENAQLFAQSQVKYSETKILYDLNLLLTTTFDVGEIYRRAVREFVQQLTIERCAISSWEKDENTVTVQAEYAQIPDEKEGEYLTEYDKYNLIEHEGTCDVLSTFKPLLRRLDDEDLEESERAALEEIDMFYVLEMALVHGNEAIGIVEIYRSRDKAPFDENTMRLAQAMANLTALALNNAILTSNTRGQLAQFSSLLRLSNVLSEAPTLFEIYKGARREILSLVEASGIAIVLRSANSNFLEWKYGYEFGEELDLSNLPPMPISRGFSGYVARTREILYTEKTPEKIAQYNSFSVGTEKGFWLGLPMVVANEVIGVLIAENERPFTTKEVELMKTIAGPIAIAINNLMQFEEVEKALHIQSRQRVQLQTASEIAAAATSIRQYNELMDTAVTLIQDRFNLYYVGLFLINKSSQQAILQTGTGKAGQMQVQEGHSLTVGGQSLIGGATADGEPRITQDVTLDEEWLPNPHLPDTRSELALPLRVHGRVIGALTVQSVEPHIFDIDTIDTLFTMADQLAVAIENAQLLAEAEKQAHEKELLRQVNSQMQQSADVNQIVEIGLQTLSERFGGLPVRLKLGRTTAVADDSNGNN